MLNTVALQPFCRQVRFDPGDVLRQMGQHYTDMYVLTEGALNIDRGPGATEKLLVSGAGAPIGEIGFLRGCTATATVTARTPSVVLVIDDPVLTRLEREQPALTTEFMRELAQIADERTSYNLVHTFDAPLSDAERIEVVLCRNKEMLDEAQRLRYEVYCQELQRQSPYADHEKKIISDHLDETGHTFVATENGHTIGTLRLNVPAEGAIGAYEELYGMTSSRHHPRRTAICTKFIVKRSKRGGAASLRLISAVAKYGLRNSIREGYIDCIPALLPYYKALGFRQTGPAFLHRENGPSHPMNLDLEKHGKRLARPFGKRAYLSLFLRAKAIKLTDRLRPSPSFTRSH